MTSARRWLPRQTFSVDLTGRKFDIGISSQNVTKNCCYQNNQLCCHHRKEERRWKRICCLFFPCKVRFWTSYSKNVIFFFRVYSQLDFGFHTFTSLIQWKWTPGKKWLVYLILKFSFCTWTQKTLMEGMNLLFNLNYSFFVLKQLHCCHLSHC